MKEQNVKNNNDLKNILIPLFNELDAQNVLYCICGNYHDLPEYTTHDVDIWTENFRRFEKIMMPIAHTAGFKLYLYNRTANGSNNIFYKIAGDGSMEFVRIDVLEECAWSSFIPIVEAQDILNGRLRYKNFFIAEPLVETCMHLLYPLIHNGRIKEKYKEKIVKYHNEPEFARILTRALGSETAKDIITKAGAQKWESIERETRKYKIILIKRCIKNINLKRLKYFADFLWTNIYRLIHPSGLFIVIIGSDGAGKTTIIGRLEKFFTQHFMSGKVEKFYWRPYLLPPLRNLMPFKKNTGEADDAMPGDYRGRQSNSIMSFIKFFYYLADYILGRKKYQSAWSRGGVVCFDRYYYDHVIYPERFSFNFPRRIMTFFQRFIPEPDLIFFLHCPPEVLSQRKMEHPLSEVARQNREYEELIANIPNAYSIDTTSSIEDVERKIITICVQYMSDRLKKNGIYNG